MGHESHGGHLAKFTSIGCYPILYVSAAGDCLCAACASAPAVNVVASDINWEDPALFCDECSERIESAYAEDEVEEDAGEDTGDVAP
jgi:hypothetical protein